MRFTIVKNTGTNQPPQLSYEFIPPGGTIGRSPDNNWVLPDEEQAIARLQAIVSISSDGECRITNRGAASEILLNTIPMAPDRQIEVRDGDMLNMGEYQIQVVNVSQSAPPVATTRVLNTTRPFGDKSENIPNEIWDGLENIFTATEATPTQEARQKPQELHDNNPLIKPQQHQERNPIDPLAQMETTISLDDLQFRATDPVTMFNPDTDLQQENILNDTTPSTLLQSLSKPSSKPLSTQRKQYDQRDDKSDVDPLALFTNKLFTDKLFTDKHTRKEIKNDDPLSLMLDNAEPLAPLDNTTISASQENPYQDKSAYFTQASSPPLPPLFATEDTTEKLTQKPPDADPQNQNPVNHQYPINNADKINSADHTHNSTSRRDNGIDASERLNIDPVTYKINPAKTDEVKLEGKLLAALLDGMGLNHFQPLQFDEHIMYQLGKLLSQLSQGIMALNAARTQLKHQANAEMTQILTDANNPFKLLPSGQAVLVQMFGTHMPGFMAPEQATRDILIELQAHQLGMIAGLHSITADILQSFEPDVIERRAREEGGFSRLSLSSTYKASLWDYLSKYHQKIAHEFKQHHVLFGENFLQAYEAEVERYKNSQDRSRK
ncbi:type VI secretion system-associated FHA domain protein [Xenorhabdus beddingii]|nr:FHA domain-containing protein [Xenorhabdus beddingii]